MPTPDKRLLTAFFLLPTPAAQVTIRDTQIFGHLADRFAAGLHEAHGLHLKCLLIGSMFALHEIGLLFLLFLPILDPLQKRNNYTMICVHIWSVSHVCCHSTRGSEGHASLTTLLSGV